MAKLVGRAIIGQSGGPTSVINQSVVGLVQEAVKHDEITAVYGARHGVQGIMDEEFIDLAKESKETLEAVANTPSAGLGTVRLKPGEKECEKIFGVCRKHDVRYFFYIGGDDSAKAAGIINGMANAANYDLRVMHVPKTVDNDLEVNDHSPGYGSAARFVASAHVGENQENRAMPGIKINVMMGRNAGWLTAASVLARKEEDDGPHLVYLPERNFDRVKFLLDVRAVYEKLGRCMIAVSEGIHDAKGGLVTTSKEQDSFGHSQLSGTGFLGDYLAEIIKETFLEDLGYPKIRVRADTYGYLQRCFPSCISPVDAKEAREVGIAAVREATSGNVDGSMTIKRVATGANYAVEYERVGFEAVVGKTQTVPDKYISADGNNVLDSFKEYAMPLIGELPKVGTFVGYPV